MKHHRQKLNECFICAVATLAGKSPAGVKRAILGKELSKESWSYIVTSSPSSDRVQKAKARVSKYLAKHLPWVPIEAFCNLGAISCGSTRVRQLTQSNLHGVGILTIVHRRMAKRHIVAFQDGVIFDSGKSGELPASAWLADMLVNWEIENIWKKS